MRQRVSFPGNVFPVGAHVFREPSPEIEEILGDLATLKKLGFNMIKIQEHWAIDEPVEGQINLDRIERIMARAGELSMGVYLGLTMEQAPAWLWRKYPDCRMVYNTGQPYNDPTQYTMPADAKPGPCWDHPGARAAGERFIGQLARQLGRFENLWVWNTWQEIGLWNCKDSGANFCFCEHTLSRFRDWLREKYQTLKNLNQTWCTAFGDWQEVTPPRLDTDVPSFIDWRYFMDDVYLTRALEWKTQAFRQNDPKGRPVFSHVASPVPSRGAEWRWAKTGDFFGVSNYPLWRSISREYEVWDDEPSAEHLAAFYKTEEMWDMMSYRADIARCAGGRQNVFWGAEFQGGPISTSLQIGKEPSADDIRRWMLSGLAAGMTGISFWNARPERFWRECNGFGLLDRDGGVTERAAQAGRIAGAINSQPELFSQGVCPQSEVALLVNEDLYHFCVGTDGGAANHLSVSLRGNYNRLWQMGVFADFVEGEEVAAGGLKGYKVAILPFPVALGKDYFDHLREFVAQGGVLISEACPGRFDNYGMCPRSELVAGAEEVFGVRHQKVRTVSEPGEKWLWTPKGRTHCEVLPAAILEGVGRFAGTRLRASFWLETLTPVTAEPILKVGDQVVGTMNTYGKGKAILLGTVAGHSATMHRLEGPEGVFEKIFDQAGVRPDRCGRLLRRRRVHEGRQAWFLINPDEQDAVEVIDTSGFAKVRDLLGDAIISQATGQTTVRIVGGSLACLVLG